MNKQKIHGTITEVKELKRGERNGNEWVLVKVKINNGDYISFDKKLLEAEGLEGDFMVWEQEKNGKKSYMIEYVKPELKNNLSEQHIKDIYEATKLIMDGVNGIKRCVEIIEGILEKMEYERNNEKQN